MKIHLFNSNLYFIVWSSNKNWYLLQLITIRNIRYIPRVKWSNPGPPLHPDVVAIEKRAFWSPSTTVANFTYL